MSLGETSTNTLVLGLDGSSIKPEVVNNELARITRLHQRSTRLEAARRKPRMHSWDALPGWSLGIWYKTFRSLGSINFWGRNHAQLNYPVWYSGRILLVVNLACCVSMKQTYHGSGLLLTQDAGKKKLQSLTLRSIWQVPGKGCIAMHACKHKECTGILTLVENGTRRSRMSCSTRRRFVPSNLHVQG